MLPVSKRPETCLCGCGIRLPLTGRVPKRFLRGHGTRALDRKKFCACGCGVLIPALKTDYTPRLYVNGHRPTGERHANYRPPELRMKAKVSVTCGKCLHSHLKRKDSIKNWSGLCKSCALRDPNREIIERNERARREAYSLIHNTLRRLHVKKLRKSADLLGYTPGDLYHHLTQQLKPGMTWEERGLWHIDHIKPVSQFVREGITDPKIINALSNLQCLWKFENMAKGAKSRYLTVLPQSATTAR